MLRQGKEIQILGAYDLHTYIVDPFLLASDLCVISDMH